MSRLTAAGRSRGRWFSRKDRSQIGKRSRVAAALGATIALVGGTFVVSAPILTPAPAQAVFAEGGSGLFKSSIDWFSFGEEGPIRPDADGTVSYANERTIGDHTLRTTCTIGNIAEQGTPTSQFPLTKYRSGFYQGDGLSHLYNIGGAGWSNQLVNGIATTTDKSTAEFRILCGAELVDNGKDRSVPVPLQGLVVADAESTNGHGDEFIDVSPIKNSQMAGAAEPAMDASWRVIDRFRPDACTTDVVATVSGASNSLRLKPNGPECIGLPENQGRGAGPMAVGFLEGATSADVVLKGGGRSAVAIGMVIDTDFGDAPESYGEAGALYAPVWSGGEVPLGGTQNVWASGFTLGTAGQPAQMLGSLIDSEEKHDFSWDALLDDERPLGSNSDEDALDVDNPPNVKYEPGEATSITLECTVADGAEGHVAGWIDWDRDGVFDPTDEATEKVQCENGSATLDWVAPAGATVPTNGEQTFLRLRIAADVDDLQPTGMAMTGEVEDYALDAPLITANKTSDPEQGTVLNPGDDVTYTLTFANQSDVVGPVRYSDDLSVVFADADLVTGPTVAGPSSVQAELAGTQINVTGDLAKGETATVTYTFKVKADATHGERLTNFLLLSDGNGNIIEEEPGVCLPENPRCTDHPIAIPELEVTKLADPPSGETVSAGERITYQVLFHNWGAAEAPIDWVDDLSKALDDADFEEGSLRISGDLEAEFDAVGQRIVVTGALGATEYSVLRYSVIVKDDGERGDDELVNYVLESGQTPPTTCDPATELCTVHPVLPADISATKSADPATGETVVAGQELTYTLSFTNSGESGGEVNYIDDLSRVLDDADFVADSVEAPAAWTVTGPTDGKLTIVGSLAIDETQTVSYKVKVKADGERGDETLANFLFEEGTTPPTVCEPGAEGCTTHPAGKPALEITKTSDPESGTVVAADDKLSYTLTFDNSKGTAPAPVNHVDHLADVLDDAIFDEGPLVEGNGLTADRPAGDDKIFITGEVAAGETATVTYSVTVMADGEGDGNNKLSNFLREEGTDPPTTCEPEDESCTTHPAPEADLVVQKSANPASGETVAAGDEITYTLTFDNRGHADAPVKYTDDLSDVLDDADLIDGPTVSPAGMLTGAITGGTLGITGTVPANSSAVVNYTVKVMENGEGDGNNSLANFLFEGDEKPPTCDPETGLCTTHPAPEPALSVSKSSNPADGTTVGAGDDLTYTLTFDNSQGGAAATVDHVDDLSDVLDDATFDDASLVAGEGLTAVKPDADGKLVVTGTVAAGKTVTVTYTVTVMPNGEGDGNNTLSNFLLEAGTEPPTTCEPGDDSCTVHPAPEPALTISKSSDPASGETVAAGSVLTYTLTFDNSLGGAAATVNHVDDLSDVLDDATFDDASLVAGEALTAVKPGADGRLVVTGSVPAGETAKVTYSVTVMADGEGDGNNSLANFLFADGEEPPTTCEPGKPCTVHPAPEPALSISKSSDPADGTTVAAGDDLTYTLTLDNSQGGAAATVNHVDDLTGVLDDANVTVDPTVTPAGTLAGEITGGKLVITGKVPANSKATVSYTVTVKPDAERGDHTLANFLLEAGIDPPTTCEPGNDQCTTHPVPNVQAEKHADPANGEAVTEGQELSYTLTFTNSGTAAGAVAYRDSLADVLDDADFVAGSLSATGGLTSTGPTDDEIVVTGELAAGATATVTYTVQVKPDAERESTGNSSLTNFLFGEGEKPPTTCESGDDQCTTHPTPDLVVEKGADPASGSSVIAGQELSYTLTFANLGTAPGKVAFEDRLTDVLDDAELVGGPQVDTDALRATLAGDVLAIAGVLQPGDTATVTYTVKVKADGARGDDVLANFVVRPGQEPPTTCDPAVSICTEHPVGQIVAKKSVDPKSGTDVSSGEKLSYTLTFENVGPGSAQVAHTDDLSDVLDDAELTDGPTATGGLQVTGPEAGALRITGTLAAGERATVTYEVTVKRTADAGNGSLANFLFADGQTPPSECLPESELCTTNPVTPDIPVTPLEPAKPGPTDPAKPTPPISETGAGGPLPWLIGGGAIVLLGVALVVIRRIRERGAASDAAAVDEHTAP